MTTAAGTHCRSEQPDRVTCGAQSLPPTEPTVATRLVGGDAEPFPYTKIRDWIALLAQSVLSDGAFRLYYISRSVIWEHAKGGPPPKPVIEITYEEYAAILGRSARTISRFAEDLFTTGLWEEVERTHRSIRVPGKARPEVRTVLMVRVHDYPPEPWAWDGPVKTWDVLSRIRESKRMAQEQRIAAQGGASTANPDGCVPTHIDTQSDLRKQPREATNRSGKASKECDPTDLSGQSPASDCTHTSEDQQQVPSPAEKGAPAGRTDLTDLSEPRTDLSSVADVSAGQTPCTGALKKKKKKEQPSLPPTPSGPPKPRESLNDELAMFSPEAVTLVAQLYDKTLTHPGLQPLSATDRAGLARRIDSRLAEGWSLSRVRAVLTGGSLVGVKMPGRLWAGRLDDMPAYPAGTSVRPIAAPADTSSPGPAHRPPDRPGRAVRPNNDSSALPDPNPGKTRYEVPDDRGRRMTVRWTDSRRVLPWCGWCSHESRCLRPTEAGRLPGPCPHCHPDPDAFAAVAPQTDTAMAHTAATNAD